MTYVDDVHKFVQMSMKLIVWVERSMMLILVVLHLMFVWIEKERIMTAD